MPINYQFFKQLQFLLQNPEARWQGALEERITAIDLELKTLQVRNAEKAGKMQARIDNSKSDYSKSILTEHYEKFIKFAIPKSKKLLLDERKQIEHSLENNSFSIGAAPFESIEQAKFMLANIHVLEEPSLNQNNVAALKNMLHTNFTTLYNQEVYKEARLDKSKVYNDNLLQKLLSKETLTLKDFNIETYEERFNELEKAYQEKIKFLEIKTEENLKELKKEQEEKIKALKAENEHELKFLENISNIGDSIKDSLSYKEQTIEIMKFIGQFYPEDVAWYIKTIGILHYFDEVKAVEEFLSQIDYSAIHTIEHDIFPGDFEKSGIKYLDEEERTLWREINKKYAKEGIKIFSRAWDIKNSGVSIIDLYTNSKNDLAETFKEVKEIVKNLKFEGEKEYPEIARLCHEHNATEETFKKIISLKFKTKDNLPDLRYEFNIKGQKFTFKKLPTSENIKALFIGKSTKSCEFVGGLGEEAVISAVTQEDAGFYVITDRADKIIADCYGWNGKGENSNFTILSLDSYEHLEEAKKIFFPLLEKLAEEKDKKSLLIYMGCGGKTPKLDAIPTNKIKPLNEKVYQHSDSTWVYEIVKGIREKELLGNEFSDCKEYGKFFMLHPTLNWTLLQNKYSELFKTISSPVLSFFSDHSVIINNLIAQNEIKSEDIISFIVKNYPISNSFSLNSNNVSIGTKIDCIVKIFEAFSDTIRAKRVIDQLSTVSEKVIKEVGINKIIDILRSAPGLPYLFNTELIKEDLKIKIINHVLELYETNIEKACRIMKEFSAGINNIVLEKADIDALVKFFAINENLSSLCYPRNVSPDNDQNLINTIIDKTFSSYPNDIKKASRVLDGFRLTDPAIINEIGIDKLIPYFSSCEYIGLSIFSSNEISALGSTFSSIQTTLKTKAQIIKKTLELCKDDMQKADKMLSKFSGWHGEIEQITLLDKFIEACYVNENSCGLINRTNVLTENKVSIVNKVLSNYETTDAAHILSILGNIDGFVLKRIDHDVLIKICANNTKLPTIFTPAKHIKQATKNEVIAEIFDHKDEPLEIQKILSNYEEPVECLGDMGSREL